MTKLPPVEAAQRFIAERFSNCLGAIPAGSVVRGEATETSDLDIVVFDQVITSAYRESMIFSEWAVEVFVHNLSTYKEFFQNDIKRARPSLIRMVSEGIVLIDRGIIEFIKVEANLLLKKGPDEWDETTIRTKRYFITDALDDFIGSTDTDEGIFIANHLADALHEFVLRTNGCWIGASKWVVRSLKQYDESFAKEFTDAFNVFFKFGDKKKVVKLAHQVLEPHGGTLFDGFSVGKIE